MTLPSSLFDFLLYKCDSVAIRMLKILKIKANSCFLRLFMEKIFYKKIVSMSFTSIIIRKKIKKLIKFVNRVRNLK